MHPGVDSVRLDTVLLGKKRRRKSEDVGAAAMRAAVADFLRTHEDEQVPTWMHKTENRRTWKQFAEDGGWLELGGHVRAFGEHVEKVAEAGEYGSTLELYALWAMGVRVVTVRGAKLNALTPEFQGDLSPLGTEHAIAYYCGGRGVGSPDHFDVLISEVMVKSLRRKRT
jgi:hypothetical protein